MNQNYPLQPLVQVRVAANLKAHHYHQSLKANQYDR
jgi:hypothetical protein